MKKVLVAVVMVVALLVAVGNISFPVAVLTRMVG